MTHMRRIIFHTLLLASLGVICSAATAQRKQAVPRHKLDPYTKNDPEALAKIGYVTYEPEQFGAKGTQAVSCRDIENHLAYAQFRCIETPHLVIMSSLQSVSTPSDPIERKRLRAELTRLKEKGLPKVNPKTRQLDPWLRLHLIAMRLEETYAEVQSWLGVTDKDFPKAAAKIITSNKRYMGTGPFLGQTGKFLFLITEQESTYTDYLKTYVGRDSKFGQRWNFKGVGSLFYGIGANMEGGRLRQDRALHANLVFNLTHNLIDGYRFYAYDLPVWIKVGLTHWFERRVSPKWNSFDQNEGSMADKKTTWKWEPQTRRLLSSKKGSPFAQVYTWRDYGQVGFNDHVLIWSRWDFLMSFGKEKFAEFMLEVKGRVDPETWLPDDADLVGATRTALQKVYGLTPLTLDPRWRAWVIKNYSTR